MLLTLRVQAAAGALAHSRAPSRAAASAGKLSVPRYVLPEALTPASCCFASLMHSLGSCQEASPSCNSCAGNWQCCRGQRGWGVRAISPVCTANETEPAVPSLKHILVFSAHSAHTLPYILLPVHIAKERTEAMVWRWRRLPGCPVTGR